MWHTEDEIARQMAADGQQAVQHARHEPDAHIASGLVGWERSLKYLVTGFTQFKRRK